MRKKLFGLLGGLFLIGLSLVLVAAGSVSAGPVTQAGDETPPAIARTPGSMSPRIVGGQNADPGEYPWQVRVLPSGFLCGGTLIDEEWVLTAAHCIYNSNGSVMNPASVSVVLGDYNKDSTSNDGTEQVRTVSQVIPHPNYNQSTFDNDAALLKLSSPALIRPGEVEIIPLNTDPNIETGSLVTVTGWGTTRSGGSTPSILQEVTVPVVSNQACNARYGNITSNMVCAGFDEGGKDSCQGDSGGPLIMPDGNNGFKHIGIVSFGFGCAEPGTPGVYARTSAFINWIAENIVNIGTPMPTSTATSTPTATPTAAPSSSATPTPADTVEPLPTVPPVGNELLLNGSFDQMPLGTGWIEQSTLEFDLIGDFPSSNLNFDPDSAPYLVWLGGANGETSRLSQGVTLPADGQIFLNFSFIISSVESACDQDIGRLLVNTTIVATFEICSEFSSSVWEEVSLDLTQFGGESKTISFELVNNGALESSLFIDSASLIRVEATPVPTFTPTPATGSVNSVQNGDFENGQDGSWVETSPSNFDLILSDANSLPLSPFDGSYLAWLGGQTNEDSQLSQTILVPESADMLEYRYAIFSNDSCGFDFGEIQVDSEPVTSFELCRENQIEGWQRGAFDISSRAGTVITLDFVVDNDNLFPSSLLLDGILITADGIDGVPSPTPTPSPALEQFEITVSSGPNGINLAWEAPSIPTVSRYQILRKLASATQSTPFELIGTVEAPSYIDQSESLLIGESYLYQVMALNGNDETVAMSNYGSVYFGFLSLAIPDVIVPEGDSEPMIVPLNVVNGNGMRLDQVEIWIDYNSDVLTPVDIESRPLAGIIEWGYSVQEVDETTGRLKVVLERGGGDPIFGAGSLAWLIFEVVGEAGTRTSLDLKAFLPGTGGSTVSVLDPTDIPTDIPLSLSDGSLNVEDSEAAYYIWGDVNGDGERTIDDALLVLDYSVGGAALQPLQLDAAELNGDGVVDAGDAIYILYFVENGIWPGQSQDVQPTIRTRPEASASRTPTQAEAIPALSILGPHLLAGDPGSAYVRMDEFPETAGVNLTILYDADYIESISEVLLTASGSGENRLTFFDDGEGRLQIAATNLSGWSGSFQFMEIRFETATLQSGTLILPLNLAAADLYDKVGLNLVKNGSEVELELVDDQLILFQSLAPSLYLPVAPNP